MSDFSDNLRPANPSGQRTLATERSRSTILVKDLSQHLFPDGFLERQARVLKEMKKEKLLSKKNQLNLARPDRYKLGLARAKLLVRMAKRLEWSLDDHRMAEYLTDEMSPYFLNRSMFEVTISEQGSEEQRAYWLPLIEQWKIYGSYAQTELGHGSNVRGIELEAKWDNESKEFILHSPTLTSSKWWNGSLGRTATHAIVVAQLLLPENGQEGSSGDLRYKSLGPKPFVVRVRDPKTHQPLPGIIIGDIGPKYGYTSMDNAYMLFDNFRIPHSTFLSRYFQIDKNNGSYTSKAQNPAVVYGSLTHVRVNIIMHARLILARAVTIAARYLTIRRQFHDRDEDSSKQSEVEMAVLDYPTVQIRVLPLVATTFALHYSGMAMGEQYAQTRQGIGSGDFTKLADMHATSSGLKSVCTTLAADGIETCRRACGGHGFGGSSGFIPLNNDYLSKPTVEGDNWMITQQTASYLIKRVSAVLDGRKAHESSSTPQKYANETEHNIAQYLQDRDQGRIYTPTESALPIHASNGRGDEAIVRAFERRAAHLAVQAHKARNIDQRAWTSLLVQLHHLSNAHSQAILVRNFYDSLFSSSPSSPSSSSPSHSSGGSSAPPASATNVLKTCFRLFALHTMNLHARDFSTSGAVSDADLDALPDAILALMGDLRPHVVALVDAWAIPDYLLDSALGRHDGRVYEDLFHRAHRQNPLNNETFNPYYWDEEIVMGSGDAGRQVLSKL